MQILARGWLVYTMTDSALALGLVSISWGIPLLLFSPLSGVVTDRVNKRNLLILTQSATLIITLVVAVLITTGAIQLWHLIAAALVTGILFAFDMPSYLAIVPELVGERHLMNAVALNSAAMNLSRIAAPALAGVLIGFIGIAGVYYIVVASFAVFVINLLMIRTSRVVPSHPNRSIKEDLARGLGYIRHSPSILNLLGMAFIFMLFGMPYMMLLPIFAKDVLNIGASGLGILMAVVGVGALIGSLIIASLGDFKHKGLIMMSLALGFGMALVLFASSSIFYLSLLVLLPIGAAGGGYMTLNNTLLLRNTSNEMRGRVMSLYMVTFALMPIGTLPIGAIADAIGAPLAVGAGGAIVALFAILMILLRPSVRRLE